MQRSPSWGLTECEITLKNLLLHSQISASFTIFPDETIPAPLLLFLQLVPAEPRSHSPIIGPNGQVRWFADVIEMEDVRRNLGLLKKGFFKSKLPGYIPSGYANRQARPMS